MAKKSLYKINVEYILMIVLLMFSGNPIIPFLGKYAVFVTAIAIFFLMYHKIKQDFYVSFLLVAAGLLLIFLCQNYVLGYVSWLGALNYITTFFLGGLIFYLLNGNFAYRYFIVVFYIALISLAFYPVVNILNIRPPGLIQWGADHTTYLIYTYVEAHHYRNCGMFWEPGAFAGVLTLCLAFNVKHLPSLWRAHKFKVIVILLALLTTRSTTGYIICFFTGVYFLLFFVRDKTVAFTLLPVFLVLAVVVYTNATFLQEKVEEQSQSSMTLSRGEFSNTRFGSFVFDLHYIQKHPLVGNGFDEVTRYADDPEIIQLAQMGVNIANANGFSNYMACMGIPFMFVYLLLSFLQISKMDRRVGILVVMVIFLTLFGEQWLNYSLYTGIIFFRYRKNTAKKRVKASTRLKSLDYSPGYQI